MDKLLLNPEQVAESLGFGRGKVYSMIAAGEIPSIRIRGSVRVPADSLRRWIAEHTKEVATAYMPVPRCDGCKHWDSADKKEGQCMLMYVVGSSKMWPDYRDGINTAADFGCVQWETK